MFILKERISSFNFKKNSHHHSLYKGCICKYFLEIDRHTIGRDD